MELLSTDFGNGLSGLSTRRPFNPLSKSADSVPVRRYRVSPVDKARSPSLISG
jgi:hypothetical protein